MEKAPRVMIEGTISLLQQEEVNSGDIHANFRHLNSFLWPCVLSGVACIVKIHRQCVMQNE